MKKMVVCGAAIALGLAFVSIAAAARPTQSTSTGRYTPATGRYTPATGFSRTTSTSFYPGVSGLAPRLNTLPLNVQPRTIAGPTTIGNPIPFTRTTTLPLSRTLSGPSTIGTGIQLPQPNFVLPKPLGLSKGPAISLPLGKSALAAQKTAFAKKIAAGYCLNKNCGAFNKCIWNNQYGCFLFWCSLKCGWFYFYEPCDCFVPYCDIITYLPVYCFPPVEVWFTPCVVYGVFSCPVPYLPEVVCESEVF